MLFSMINLTNQHLETIVTILAFSLLMFQYLASDSWESAGNPGPLISHITIQQISRQQVMIYFI
jgi:hypothetical protein